MVDEEVLKKSGLELYKELLCVYSCAEYEDYYKGGVWADEKLRTDLQLIVQHRKEAGAPDPTPLEEVVVPELPKPPAGLAAIQGIQGLLGAARPQLTLPGSLAGALTRPTAAGALGALVAAAKPAAARPLALVQPAATGQLGDLRLINLFVQKHKLQATKTNVLLAKIDTAARRRYVVTHFNPTAGTDPMEALEQYIAQCEKTNAWGNATSAPALTSPTVPLTLGGAIRAVRPVVAKPLTVPVAQGLGVGVKRPLAPITLLDPSKRPRITLPGGVLGGGGGARPPSAPLVRPVVAKPAAILARPPMGVRPVSQVALAQNAAAKAKEPAQGKAPAGALIRNLLKNF